MSVIKAIQAGIVLINKIVTYWQLLNKDDPCQTARTTGLRRAASSKIFVSNLLTLLHCTHTGWGWHLLDGMELAYFRLNLQTRPHNTPCTLLLNCCY